MDDIVGLREARRGRLYEELVDQLQALVLSGRLQPGEKLPTTNQLTAKFAVSRTVVREAIGALAEKGLVEVKHGKGVYVLSPTPDRLIEPMQLLLKAGDGSLLSLLEVREILEVEIAALAAERATKAEIDALEAVLRQEERMVESPEAYVESDLEFHDLLSRATHNDVLPILLHPLSELLRESRRVTVRPQGATNLSHKGHIEILAAVVRGDKEEARTAMRRHFSLVRKTLTAVGGGDHELNAHE